MSNRIVFFLTSPTCALCSQALPKVQRAVSWSGLKLEVIEIQERPELSERFVFRIPVVSYPETDCVVMEGEIRPLRLWWKLLWRRIRR